MVRQANWGPWVRLLLPLVAAAGILVSALVNPVGQPTVPMALLMAVGVASLSLLWRHSFVVLAPLWIVTATFFMGDIVKLFLFQEMSPEEFDQDALGGALMIEQIARPAILERAWTLVGTGFFVATIVGTALTWWLAPATPSAVDRAELPSTEMPKFEARLTQGLRWTVLGGIISWSAMFVLYHVVAQSDDFVSLHSRGLSAQLAVFVVPQISLVLAIVSQRAQSRRLERLSLGWVVLYGTFHMIFQASRGQLLSTLIPYVVATLSRNGITRRLIIGGLAALTAVIALRPVLDTNRQLRNAGYENDLSGAAVRAFTETEIRGDGDALTGVHRKTRVFLFRVMGAEGAIGAAALGDVEWSIERFADFEFDKSQTFFEKYSSTIGSDNPSMTGLSPGLIAWLAIMGGIPCVVLGCIALMVIVTSLWHAVLRATWVANSATLGFLALNIHILAGEGYPEVYATTGPVTIALIFLGEWVARWCMGVEGKRTLTSATPVPAE